MLSLKDDQNNTMNDINALLANRDKEQSLIGHLKQKVRNLSNIHKDMEEVQSFILQMTKGELESVQAEDDEKKSSDSGIGSSGDFNHSETSDK